MQNIKFIILQMFYELLCLVDNQSLIVNRPRNTFPVVARFIEMLIRIEVFPV